MPYTFTPVGWLPCDGRTLPVAENEALAALLGNMYGGDGTTTFGLPDMRARVPVSKNSGGNLGSKGGSEMVALSGPNLPKHSHNLLVSTTAGDQPSPEGHYLASGSSLDIGKIYSAPMPLGGDGMELLTIGVDKGGNETHENRQPFLALNYFICVEGIYPSGGNNTMDPPTPFVGEIRPMAFGITPRGWMPCEGQLLQAAQHTPLFSILGNNFGGGTTNFNLPDLRGRVALGVGVGTVDEYELGDTGGVADVALTADQVPPHNHAMNCWGGTGSSTSPVGTVPAKSKQKLYTTGFESVEFAKDALQMVGGGMAHTNMQPYLPINYIIAIEGIYPERGDN